MISSESGPRTCITGVRTYKPTDSGDEFGVDWFSSTTKANDPWERVGLVDSMLGDQRSYVVGRQGFQSGVRWSCGASLYWGHAAGVLWLDVPGGACGALGGQALYALARTWLIGAKCTRLDLRRDQWGDGLTLIDDVVKACEAGQLRHVRRYKRFPERDAETQAVTGDGVYLGSVHSPRFVRLYDKGLETGELPAGQRLRWESQFRGDLANAAAVKVFGAGADGWCRAGLAVMAGVVDFRMGGRGQRVEVASRPVFWERYLASCGSVRVAAARPHADALRWVDALWSSYGRVLRGVGSVLGETPGQVLDRLAMGEAVGNECGPMVGELLALLQAGTVSQALEVA